MKKGKQLTAIDKLSYVLLAIALGIYVFNMAKGATNTNSLDELEVSQFNQTFTNYSGRQIGSNVISLLDKCVSNAAINKDANDRLPDIYYTEASGATVKNIISKAGAPNGTKISELRAKIAERHYYYVEFSVDDYSGLIKAIGIAYKETDKAAVKGNIALAGVN